MTPKQSRPSVTDQRRNGEMEVSVMASVTPLLLPLSLP